MKKIIYLISVLLAFSFLGVTSFAEEVTGKGEQLKPTAKVTEQKAEPKEQSPEPKEQSPEQTEDRSSPRVMVTDYSVDTEFLTPGKSSVLTVKIRNYSSSKSIRNIKLTLTDETGEIETEDMPTEFVSYIGAGSTYSWKIKLTAINNATVGKHKLNVNCEYEDAYYSSYSANDSLTLEVRQTVALDLSGVTMPNKIVEGETVTMNLTLMNTGKTTISNCKIIFESDKLESNGTVFLGEINVGESKSGAFNYKAKLGTLGKVGSKITLSYEDVFGKKYTKTTDVSTVCEKKIENADIVLDEKEEKNNGLWWLFILIGAFVGGALGFFIPYFIKDRKQRKEDNLKL